MLLPTESLTLNTRLADQRQKTAEKYLAGQLKKSKIEVADELMSLLCHS